MKKTPIHIKSILVNPNKWLELISQQFPSERHGNGLIVNNEFGKGSVSIEILQDGLYYIIINATFNYPIIYERILDIEEEHYLIVISLNEGPTFKHIGHKEYRFNDFDSINALLIPPSVPSYLSAEEGLDVKLLTIVVDTKWIKDNIIGNDKNSYLKKILNAGIPIPILERFNNANQEMIDNLFHFRYKDKIQKLSSIIFLISEIVEKISKREGILTADIKVNDINSILESCKAIEQNWKEFPSLKSLALQANMGESNFKRKFKRITGYAPYQYFMKIRLEKARELLQNTDRSVSEIGYMSGYTNLSHFSRQFKKEFGILPSEFIKKKKE